MIDGVFYKCVLCMDDEMMGIYIHALDLFSFWCSRGSRST